MFDPVFRAGFSGVETRNWREGRNVLQRSGNESSQKISFTWLHLQSHNRTLPLMFFPYFLISLYFVLL